MNEDNTIESKLREILGDDVSRIEVALNQKQYGVANEWICHAAGIASAIAVINGSHKRDVASDSGKILKDVLGDNYK